MSRLPMFLEQPFGDAPARAITVLTGLATTSIAAGIAGKTGRIMKLFAICTGAITIRFKSNGVAISPDIPLDPSSRGGFVIPFDGEQWFNSGASGFGIDVEVTSAGAAALWSTVIYVPG